ncbi:hypothetical protein [Cellulosimicrobium marinum]|uniref:hypothetical protein n=1 Tax=Cellulosimicrobium marinum TaxID=1638992 RepID=UPI001E2FECFE|nr:hypothetical protein [Cellulosimicrobium marinum]MCB7135261.1 hypothetical protein [Cellulosimicrobium marinum]
MRSPVRAVAHGAVLVAVAGLCVATVLSGAFDVVTLGAAPGAVSAGSSGGSADPAATDSTADAAADAPADPGTDPATSGTAADGADAEHDAAPDGEEPVAAEPADPACREAEVAWGAAAKAQVNLSVDHPAALVTGFTTARDTLAATEPPAQVAHDWAVVSTYLTMLADAVEAAGPHDPEELARSIDRVGRRIDAGALTTSSQRVTEFFQAGCPA